MFRGFSQIFSKSNKDLRKRIYFTLFCLGLFCLGTTVTIPWATKIYSDLGFLEIFNLMSGGGLQNFSIFALGVSPYITASIITELLQMDIIPYFKELKDEGYAGRQKINKITRYLAIILAFIQAYALCVFYMNSLGTMEMIKTALVMTAGTAFCLWMGDQITKKGLGNGSSMIIMAGIIQSMPRIFIGAYTAFIKGEFALSLGIFLFIVFILVYLIVLVGIIYIQLAERRIPIQYANRTTSAYGAEQNFLPIKINSAGVIPVIFAQILLTVPSTVVGLLKNQKAISFVNKYIVYTSNTGLLLYLLLILFFGYFYTFMVMNPEEMSKNLNERGGYIPGVRPGADTSKYISDSIGKLTIVGSIFLMIIAVLPVLVSKYSGLPSSVTIGGTGLLIVVGVAIETYKQMESSLLARSYQEKRKRLR
jgi:preprotein translocase subunit SecY